MQSIVIGATGIVGGYIVEQLVRAGQRPLGLSRAPREASNVDWVQGDLAEPAALALPAFETLYCTVEIGRASCRERV